MVMKVANILKIKGLAVKTVKPQETAQAFANYLKDERIGAMIVSQDGAAVDGIISERDLAYGLATHGSKISQMKVSELMTKVVISCEPNDDIEKVMNLMTQRRIRHLPVKDSDKLVGIISIGDVVNLYLSQRLMAIARI